MVVTSVILRLPGEAEHSPRLSLTVVARSSGPLCPAMYPMTTQPASDLRHNIWSLVFSRLGQSSPPFGAGGLFGGRLVMQIL